MSKVVLKIHVSIDGYIRGSEDDTLAWVFASLDDELKAWEIDMLWQIGTHVMGRNLYDDMAAHWPTSTEEFAPPMNEIPKVVFSKSLKQADGQGTRIASGDLAVEIARLKQESGKDILVHGGASLVHSLNKLGLIDEYRLIVHPVVLGAGLPLFTEAVELKRQDVKVFPAGATVMIYGRP
jgi:dihydrofolate reductase